VNPSDGCSAVRIRPGAGDAALPVTPRSTRTSSISTYTNYFAPNVRPLRGRVKTGRRRALPVPTTRASWPNHPYTVYRRGPDPHRGRRAPTAPGERDIRRTAVARAIGTTGAW